MLQLLDGVRLRVALDLIFERQVATEVAKVLLFVDLGTSRANAVNSKLAITNALDQGIQMLAILGKND